MKSQYVLPISIVIVGALIAGAIFLISRNPGAGAPAGKSAVKPVEASEHILGNPDAPVKIVEYADLECPFCKDYQATMNQLMQYYGASGKVAWVFRPFPLGQLHSKAPKEAQAAECAAAQGGNDAFFKFIDKVYEVTPSDNGLDLAQLPVIAGQVGLNVATFQQCLDANTYADKVQASYNEAIAHGAQGTPHTVIMTSQGTILTLDGNQPYSSMRAAVDQVLTALGQSVTATSSAQ